MTNRSISVLIMTSSAQLIVSTHNSSSRPISSYPLHLFSNNKVHVIQTELSYVKISM